ncbi:MAG: hypothetical protein GY861_28825, partial [bacterium]|nr:hypothetical protein [bacterium]
MGHPQRIIIDFGKCFCLPDTPYEAGGQCVSKCPEDSKFSQIGLCVTSCSEGNAPNLKNACSTCPFKLNGLCTLKCPENYGSDLEGTCTNCKLQSPTAFFYKNKCLVTIPSTTVMINAEFNVYVDCDQASPPQKIHNGGCVPNCPENTATYEGKSECVKWKETSKFLRSGYVVDSCPEKTYPDGNNICISCKEKDKYNYQDQCIDSCPKYFLYDENNACYDCKSLGKLYLSGECVLTCPYYTFNLIPEYRCNFCKEEGGKFMVYGTRECIDKCKEGAISEKS